MTLAHDVDRPTTSGQHRRVAAVVQRRLVAMATDSVEPSHRPTLVDVAAVRRETVLVLQLAARHSEQPASIRAHHLLGGFSEKFHSRCSRSVSWIVLNRLNKKLCYGSGTARRACQYRKKLAVNDIHPRSSQLLLLNGRTVYHFVFVALFA